ncbi:glycosyltransferase [Cryobacterium frigoriphilum]|uniref:4,4'-diaponeurosporenoate glycosyltransferase n=1 Tax=Cryobacterium frigoriphilum TaxID=1259150 RepID=A0A4R9A4I0_9MICO|nr:glycosyltransferase [Cryobacterium frigoriphilum]TFD52130.1 glycosyltransferase [Cryobacterium frigoriphilum]
MNGPAGAAIVIAAHNESAVIARCLDALMAIVESGEVQVIVACNGCSDDTAEIARRRPGVVVLELAVASKAAALRAGDLAAVSGPRIYLDADVVMTATAARDIVRALQPGGALASRPPIVFESTDAAWPVRRWYRVRAQLPSIHNVLWGAGTYALSEAGRARFEQFPDIVSDDLFIDQLIALNERIIVATDPIIVHTPRRSADLLRVLKRTYRTQDEVEVGRPDAGIGAGTGAATPVSASQRAQLDDLLGLLRRNPLRAFDVALYVALIMTARVQARFRPGSTRWERDNSSRV